MVEHAQSSHVGRTERITESFIERAAFFESNGVDLFAMSRLPRTDTDMGVVICSPIYLDKVKAHRTEVELGRALAESGIATLHFDYGGFANSRQRPDDATLDGLVADTLAAIRYFEDTTAARRIGLVGIRFGALIAAAAAAQVQHAPVAFWDAAFNPVQYFREAMRARLIKDAGFVPRKLGHDEQTEKTPALQTQSTQELLKQLAGGESVDVLGYPVTGPMYRSTVDQRLVALLREAPRDVLIVESGRRLRRAAEEAVQTWTEQGLSVSVETTPPEAWWFIGESLRAPEWVLPTVTWLQRRLARPSPS